MTTNHFCLLVLSVLLVACDRQEPRSPSPSPSAMHAPVALEAGPWRGFPTDQSANVEENTIQILANGGAMRVANNPSPAVGDTITARLRLTASSPVPVRVALFRHCNADLGEEGDSREVSLSPTETDLTLRHTFEQPYDCVRVHITSLGQPGTVTVSEFSLTKE
jgi:hypothetical protein